MGQTDVKALKSLAWWVVVPFTEKGWLNMIQVLIRW